MRCSVCGGDIGLWAKLMSHSTLEVCKRCHEEGVNQLQVLVRSISAAQSFNLQYAERWEAQFEATLGKYHLSGSEATSLTMALLTNMFKLLEAGNELSEAGLKFLLNLSQKYSVGQSTTPELRDTILRVNMKEVIQSWERGQLPDTECNGLLLQRGEVCHWEEAAGLRVQRTKREYVGAYSGVSVPVPLVRGVRFRVGGFKGHPIDHTIFEDGGIGVLHITSSRLCFTGKQSVAIPYKKMISVRGFEGGFMAQTSNEKKPGIFIVEHPELTTQMLALAASPREEERTRKRGKGLLSPT